MNKKSLTRFGALGLSTAMVLTLCTAPSSENGNIDTYAKTASTGDTTDVKKSTTADDGINKEETVYVNAAADGSVENITVSDWLKNPDQKDTLTDASDLSDIKNVKGKQDYSGDASAMTWNAGGSDIYYQGTTDKQLPVDMKISYTLDGKDISAEDIAGKSGHVKIRFDYTNKETKKITVDGKEYNVAVPFMVMSGMVLDGDNFSNVSVTNGKAVSDGSKNIVLGYALPGLKDSLKLDTLDALKDVDIPDYFEVEADTTNFDLQLTMSVIMSDALRDIDVDDDTSMDDLKSDLDELKDSSKKLVDGTSDLLDGTKELDDKFGEYADGVNTLVKGINSAKSGTDKLESGSKQLAAGTKSLVKGAGDLDDGAKKLDKGAGDLKNGTDSLKSGADQVKGGTDQVKGGIASLDAGAKQLKSGSDALSSGTNTLSAGMDQFRTQYDKGVADAKTATADEIQKTGTSIGTEIGSALQASDGALAKAAADGAQAGASVTAGAVAQQIKGSAGEVNQGLTQALGSQDTLTNLVKAGTITAEEAQELGTLLATVKTTDPKSLGVLTKVISGLVTSQISDSVTASAQNPNEQLQAAITKQAAAALNNDTELKTSVQTAITGAVTKNLGSLGEYLTNQTEASQKSVDEQFTLSDEFKNTGKTNTLKDGAQALVSGTSQVAAGASALSDGTAKLSTGAGTLADGADALSKGAASLQSGAKDLKDGTKQLSDGTASAKSGASQLNTGAISLHNGLASLKSGMVKLSSGGADLSDATGQVSDGIGDLRDGADELHDGMVKFDKEGIQKLYDTVNGDLRDVANRLKAVKDAGEDYETFTKLADDQNGTVKFVIETDAIEGKDNDDK